MRNLNNILILIILVSTLMVGCSSDDPAAPPANDNNPPTVTFTFNRVAVAKGLVATLTVDVDDPDGDAVTVDWQATRGFLEPQDQGKTTMRWEAPGSVGTDTLTITASDGNGGEVTIKPVLEVGTRQDGNISSSTVWTFSESPYLLAPATDRISVLPGRALTISAGVKVYVDKADISIDVDGGQLTTVGTPANPVVIEPSTLNAEAGFWLGIQGTGDAPLIDLDYATVTHAVNAVKAVGSARVQISNCNIMVCSDAAILHESTGELVVENSAITNNLKSGIQVKRLPGQPTPFAVTIRGDSIAINGRFSDSVVYAEGEAGISLDFDDPFGAVPVDISGNEISRNDFPGIRLINAVWPTINNNGIFGNELRKATNKIDIELISPFPSGEINAKNNWWGFEYPAPSDSTQIKARIVDVQDSGFPCDICAKVLVYPWLTTPAQ